MKKDRVNNNNHKKELPLPLLIGAAVAVILCFFVMWYIRNPVSFNTIYGKLGLTPGSEIHRSEDFDGVSVSFIYVGQGDCIFINDGSSKVLIDTGEFSAYSDIERFLISGGIDELDYLIITHPHSDHVGSAASVLRHFKVDHVLIDRFDETLTPSSAAFSTFLENIERIDVFSEGILSVPENGTVIGLDNGQLEIISNGGYSDLNNSSLVIRYSYGNISFLLAGDIEKEAENDLLDRDLLPKSTVLKAAHHGSNTGTSDRMLDSVDPEYVIVSCGLDNEFGFPKEAFVKRINNSSAKLLRTDEFGNITFVLNGYSIVDIVKDSPAPSGVK